MKYTCNSCGARFDEPVSTLDPVQCEGLCPKCYGKDFDSKKRCIVCHKTDEETSLLAYTEVCPACGESVRTKSKDLLKNGLTSDEYEAFESLYDADLEEKNIY